MAVRFAGDFFGVPLVPRDEGKSALMSYFPELREVKKKASGEQEGARGVGGTKAATPFVGFKTFEAPEKEQKAAPMFAGFKTTGFGSN